MFRAILTGNCNAQPLTPIDNKDEYLVLADDLAHQSGGIAIVVYQIPNCPIVYPADPRKARRTEDAMIAFAWFVHAFELLPTQHLLFSYAFSILCIGRYEYLNDAGHNPEWLPRLPMAKAAMACMQAAEEYLAQQHQVSVTKFMMQQNVSIFN